MRTGRGFERLVNFSDAVIAIAITLLVLPLVDIPSEIEPDEGLRQILSDNAGELGGFVLSFLVIWTFWSAHHRIMEFFRGYDHLLMQLHMVFLFTLVSLPFTTQLLSSEANDQAVPLYLGTLLVSSVVLAGITARGRARPDLVHADRAEVQQWMRRPLALYRPVVLSVALVVSLFSPPVGLYLLLLLVFDNLVERLISRARGWTPPNDQN